MFGSKKKKLQRLMEILGEDVKALYKINRKYSFTNESMFDDYNKFYFNTAVYMNFNYMNACREVYKNDKKVFITFQTSLNTLLSNMSKDKNNYNELNNAALTGYEYFYQKHNEISSQTVPGSKEFYDALACVYITSVNDQEKLEKYIDTPEFENFIEDCSKYIKDAIRKIIDENILL